MLLIDAYWSSFFPPLFHLLALLPPFFRRFLSFSVNFYVAFKPNLHASNKSYCPSFFPSLFTPFSRFFPPFSPSHSIPYFRQFYITFNPNSTKNDSNKCILPIFLSVTFSPARPFSAFFRRFLFLFPSICKSLLCLSLHDYNKCILSIFLSFTFLAFSPFLALFRRI
jgi:hypothetical protein